MIENMTREEYHSVAKEKFVEYCINAPVVDSTPKQCLHAQEIMLGGYDKGTPPSDLGLEVASALGIIKTQD